MCVGVCFCFYFLYNQSFLAAVSSFSPLPHFVPLVEFKDRIDHWKWIGEFVWWYIPLGGGGGGGGFPGEVPKGNLIHCTVISLSPLPLSLSLSGHGRDSELELLILCNHWLHNIEKILVGQCNVSVHTYILLLCVYILPLLSTTMNVIFILQPVVDYSDYEPPPPHV